MPVRDTAAFEVRDLLSSERRQYERSDNALSCIDTFPVCAEPGEVVLSGFFDGYVFSDADTLLFVLALREFPDLRACLVVGENR
jgi:hypothetical protein